MKRQEQIEKAAEMYMKDIVTPLPASIKAAFVKGAEWTDEHPDLYSVTRKAVERERKHLIEKTCEWLEIHVADYEQSAGTCDSWYSTSELVDAFRKHMEEQQ